MGKLPFFYRRKIEASPLTYENKHTCIEKFFGYVLEKLEFKNADSTIFSETIALYMWTSIFYDDISQIPESLTAQYCLTHLKSEKSRTSWVLAKPRQSLQFMSQNTLLYRFIELLPIHIVICKSPSSLYKHFKDRIINQKQIIKQTEIVVELDTIDGLERSDENPQQENSNSGKNLTISLEQTVQEIKSEVANNSKELKEVKGELKEVKDKVENNSKEIKGSQKILMTK
ncbi:hypothetical protein RhiirA1_537714 [Rhizophagus irregularis]|uniref:Uncharacterized protein n=1 Tax=Rhizophagus irregularis TaxID=588596 RepID=A0A2N0RJM0_9GLOM|nr:hypothetical protein RhiirA1_537714 [Rhizophagus irregularis]